MKKCTKCKIEKPLTEFYKDKNSKDGYGFYCKSCKNEWYNEWYKSNKESRAEYYQLNKEYLTRGHQKYRSSKKEYYKEYNKNYFQSNKEIIYKRRKEYRNNHPHIHRWRMLLWNTLNSPKQDSTQKLLGYSATQLKEHLDKHGMDWGNHHIDHKIPLSWFKKDTPIHIVNDLRNLQPLPAKENLKKSNTFGEVDDLSYIHEVRKWLKKKYITTFKTKEK